MALEMWQTQGMHLQQTLSPQMQQSLHILQLPTMELRELITRELAQNPTLEEVSSGWNSLDANSKRDADSNASSLSAVWSPHDEQSGIDDFGGNGGGFVDPEAQERHQFLMDSITRPETIREAVIAQLAILDLSPTERSIAESIAGNLGPNGFLDAKIEEIAFHEKVTPLRVEEVLEKLQRVLEPPGLAARDLRECLLLQLDRQGRADSLAARLVKTKLREVARKQFQALAKEFNCTAAEVEAAAREISKLDPNPGRGFSAEPDIGIVPEVIVERESSGDFSVRLNTEELPRLQISDYYKELLGTSAGATRREVRDYLREKMRSGRFLLRSIEQRNETILAIAREIVARQKEFFLHGPGHLRPMRMSEIANALELHETTISRAVAGKTMSTPHGIFEMRYFFTTGYTSETGEEVSSEAIKERIRQMVAEEPPHKPLSDEAMARRLADEGFKVARRTIAKYREQLGILPTNLRRSCVR
jgi:RNA polymerase sigma-54 factor